jgi:ABC-2 type transport system permease protein
MADRPSVGILLARQVHYQNRVFWRTPIAAIFTVVFPLMLLLLFNALFSGETFTLPGRPPLDVAQFYAPSLAVFAAASATYTNLAISTSIARDEGILKRLLGTPLPPPVYLAGRVGSAVSIAFVAVVLMLGVGVLAYGVEVRAELLPAAIVTFAVGVVAFAALGLAIAGLAQSSDSAQALANFTILPLAFVSDVFVAIADPPGWLETIGDVFPLKHFVRSFQDAFSPFTTAPGFRWGSLAVIAAWGVFGMVVAMRTFGWEPRRPSARRRRTAE